MPASFQLKNTLVSGHRCIAQNLKHLLILTVICDNFFMALLISSVWQTQTANQALTARLTAPSVHEAVDLEDLHAKKSLASTFTAVPL